MNGQKAMNTRGMTGYADYHVSSHVSCRVGHWVIVKQDEIHVFCSLVVYNRAFKFQSVSNYLYIYA